MASSGVVILEDTKDTGFTATTPPYLYDDGTTVGFNETVLNSTIDARSSTGGGKIGKMPFLYNDSSFMYFNETRLNESIIELDTNESIRVGNLFVMLATLNQTQIADNSSQAVLIAGLLVSNSTLFDGLTGNATKLDQLNTSYDNLDKDGNSTQEMIDAVNGTALNGTKFFNLDYNNIFNPFLLTLRIPYLYNVTTVGVFNESRLNDTIDDRTASTTYKLYNVSTLSGTVTAGSNESDLLFAKDGKLYNVTEDGGASPLTIIMNFTGVEEFNTILLRLKYSGGSGHEIEVGLWDTTENDYEEEYGTITDMEDYAFIPFNVWDSTDHIISGGNNVSLRLRHVESGNPSHYISIDYAVLIDGFSTTTNTEHDSLSGRENFDTNHPLYATLLKALNNSNTTQAELINGLLVSNTTIFNGLNGNATKLDELNVTVSNWIDTNESTRFDVMVASDCNPYNYMVGVEENGGVNCAISFLWNNLDNITVDNKYIHDLDYNITFNESLLNSTIDSRDTNESIRVGNLFVMLATLNTTQIADNSSQAVLISGLLVSNSTLFTGLNSNASKLDELNVTVGNINHNGTVDTNESARLGLLETGVNLNATRQSADNTSQGVLINLRAGTGDCDGQVVQNVTTSGVECVNDAGGVDTNESTRMNNIRGFNCAAGNNFVNQFDIDSTPDCGAIAVTNDDIEDGEIKPVKLEAASVPADEDILTYESTGLTFEWHTPSELITAGTGLSWSGTTINARGNNTEEIRTAANSTGLLIDWSGETDTNESARLGLLETGVNLNATRQSADNTSQGVLIDTLETGLTGNATKLDELNITVSNIYHGNSTTEMFDAVNNTEKLVLNNSRSYGNFTLKGINTDMIFYENATGWVIKIGS